MAAYGLIIDGTTEGVTGATANTTTGTTTQTGGTTANIPAAVLGASGTIAYQTDFVNSQILNGTTTSGFTINDSGVDGNGVPCWLSRFPYGRGVNNNELAFYSDPVLYPATNPFPVVGGKRRIRTEKLTTQQSITTNNVASNYQYSTGLMSSAALFTVKAGHRVETQVAFPVTGIQGAWPAIWFMPRSGTWPPEFDQLEAAQTPGANPQTWFVTQHWDADNKAEAFAPNLGQLGLTGDISTTRTYRVDFTPTQILTYVDGVLATTQVNHSPTAEWYMILNLSFGGNWPGPPVSGQTYPIDGVILTNLKVTNI